MSYYIILGATHGITLEYDVVESILQALANLAPLRVYAAIAMGAAIENIFPPIPADTFVLFGAFLSVEGRVTAPGVFLATWSSNTVSALLIYIVARRWGPAALGTAVGRRVLRPAQLDRLAALYDAHGAKIIFAKRFLPGFRATVPVFAGISRLGFWRTATPIALASGIWYGVLIYVGAIFGRNWRVALRWLNNVNVVLAGVATLFALLLVIFWWRTRHHREDRLGSKAEEP